MSESSNAYLLRLENLRYLRWAQVRAAIRNFEGLDLRAWHRAGIEGRHFPDRTYVLP